jgi:hypothetical protein
MKYGLPANAITYVICYSTFVLDLNEMHFRYVIHEHTRDEYLFILGCQRRNELARYVIG